MHRRKLSRKGFEEPPNLDAIFVAWPNPQALGHTIDHSLALAYARRQALDVV